MNAQISDNKDANVSEALKSFREDDTVKAVVLSVDLTKRRISFGIKPSYFSEEDFQMHEASESKAAGSEDTDEEEDDEGSEGGEMEGDEEEGSGEEVEDSSVDSDDEIAEVKLISFFTGIILKVFPH